VKSPTGPSLDVGVVRVKDVSRPVLLLLPVVGGELPPAVAVQRPMGQRQGWLPAVKKSLLLAAGNLLFTIGLFVVTLGFGILCALSVIGMLALYVGAVSVLLTHALRELYVRYGVVEEPPEAVEDRGWHS
jgi:hypothetical protein